MSEKLPGAEYAPIVDIHLPAPFLEEQAAAWRTSLSSIDKSWEDLRCKTLTRRLSCTDPCDMREIWRLAALALGARDVEALNVVMRCDLDAWSLVLVLGRSYGQPERVLWRSPEPTWRGRQGEATAALCAHVWGPK